MTQWAGGYVFDIEYSSGFYVEQTPAHIDAACLVRGVEPPVEPGAPFTYCELGCGLGETAMVVAATNPQAQVWAFDFNPAHIARAQALAQLTGLDNLRLEERSFADLNGPDAPDMPLFDYVTLHGVWTWISAENQNHIVRFLQRHVRPGGVVCISYNSLPGWAPAVPVQKLLHATTRLDPTRSDFKMRTAIELTDAISKAGSIAFDAKAVDDLKMHVQEGRISYLVHEYLNDHWRPVFQTDVAASLSEAKLEFSATATMVENFPKLCLTEAQLAIVDASPTALREMMKDYFTLRPFRRDIYVRGRRSMGARRLHDRLRMHNLTVVVPPSTIKFKIDVPLGEAELHQKFYGPAFSALTEGVRAVGEMLDLPAAAGSTITAQEVIGMTIASRQVMSAPNDITPVKLNRIRAFNLVRLRHCAQEGRVTMALAGVALGAGVTVRLFEMLAYETLVLGTPEDVESVSQAALKLLQMRGDRLRNEEKELVDPAETLAVLRTNMQDVLANALPMWRRIGAI